MAKRSKVTTANLSAMKATKGGAAAAPTPAKAGTGKNDDRKGQTLRLTPEAWRQLKMLALDRGGTSHALLIEAINDLFRKHGKPPVA